MNEEILNQLENLRVKIVAEMARRTGKSFKETEEMLDNLAEETRRKIELQEEFEIAKDAEFNL